ncbi:dicer-like protein 1 [Pseudovirgaria hyperparasitica]|uniref:Dicer-like protein 1 n=1 Tax=Pseudovirgaria hyperparasitica TaxID=470096 RepID=A0A6A6VY62_9PEZI|nr:dicer-like protein 1 [Pseudovirgaria hyperparasitica]KAF2754590.1 dicer-like protein 1 [Pseudovirgaria hyperparasitica]
MSTDQSSSFESGRHTVENTALSIAHVQNATEGLSELDSNQGGDSDDDDVVEKHSSNDNETPTISEKRRIENAVLKEYAEKLCARKTKTQIKEVLKTEKDESLSIRELLAKQETSKRIETPRDYQNELFEKAKEQNIIAVLDTGSGKTHIATLLLRWILDKELADREAGSPYKTAFFLVNSVNLVFQQSDYLQCNLDRSIEGICGANSCSLWSRATWEVKLKKNDVIVCTAEVLNHCLMHSFITMDRINLLIFDEAHHAKPGANHPYAVIMKEYYMKLLDITKRPRIFGMTASPVDANNDIEGAAQDLESLLNCQIATASNLDLVRNSIHKPKEEVVRYKRLRPPFETAFHQKLKEMYGGSKSFEKLSRTAKELSSQLGSWCSDIYWQFAFEEEEARKRENRKEREFSARKGDRVMAELDTEISKLKAASEMVTGRDFGIPAANENYLSSKVIVLHEWLQSYFERETTSRCIVFVERRATARLLHLLFGTIGGEYLRVGRLVGNGSGKKGEIQAASSTREQFLTISRFRRGELNCLFATSVAEEGLDIPDCNLIVRFDLYKTMIGYVQSRGRARRNNSVFLHMVEHGNYTQVETVLQSRQYEEIMRRFCESLPEDRLLDRKSENLEAALSEERGLRSYTDAKSGARLTYRLSLAVLAHFVDCLPKQGEMDVEAQPIYTTFSTGGKYRCEVVLPAHSPVSSATGRLYSRKITARCSAAFEACIMLRQKMFLDECLLPIYAKVLPAMRNAKLALDMNSKNLYPIKMKPDFWAHGRGQVPTTAYLTLLDVSDGLDRPHSPLGLLTRKPLPSFPRFPIFMDDGKRTDVISVSVLEGISITEDDAEGLTAFTLRVYSDLFAKTFEHDTAKMSYWLAPLGLTSEQISAGNLSGDLIDWGLIHQTVRQQSLEWKEDMPNEFLSDRFLVDVWDGGRRYYSLEVAPEYQAQDVVEQVKKGAKKVQQRVIDYTVSLFNKSAAYHRDRWNMNQPVLRVERTSFRRNLLAPPEAKERDPEKQVYVCPEPLRISIIPPETAVFCYAFPAIIHRLESYLVALEATQILGLDIGPEFALEAMTKDSDNTDEHENVQNNFRRGMGSNYERLEFIGDCFLKMAASIALYVQKPEDNEFFQHCERMTMTSNKNLFETAIRLRLPEHVRSFAFSRRLWYPDSITLLGGKGHKAKDGEGPQIQKHSLGDKTVADVCEAFIGAAYMQHNDPNHWVGKHWDNAVKAVTALVSSDIHAQTCWADYFASYKVPPWQICEVRPQQSAMAAAIESKHPYHFNYPRLLRSAFMHASYGTAIERIPSYERLEFLGDSLLDMVFINDIFYRFPHADPQWLTEHKMPMVSNKFLAALCVRLRFYPHIKRNAAKLDSNIKEWVDEITELERASKGEPDYWTAAKEPPKALADVVEAFVGALFVDSGFDFSQVQRFYDLHVKWFFADMSVYDAFANNHPTTRLQNLLSVNLGCREYRIATRPLESVLPGAKPTVLAMVMVHGRVIAHHEAESGRYGRVKVSTKALDRLDGLPPFEFRALYGCDCVHQEEEDIVEMETLKAGKVEELLQTQGNAVNEMSDGPGEKLGVDVVVTEDVMMEDIVVT